MSFQEKSAIAMTAILVAVYGVYFAVVVSWMGAAPIDEIVYQPLMVAVVIPLTILAVISHIVLALLDRKGANANDERDRLISLRSERLGGYVLAVGVFAGLVLAMMEQPGFFIAHALLLFWVLAEIIDGVVKVYLYRRGA